MHGTILGVVTIGRTVLFPVSCFLFLHVFAREVLLEGDADPAVVPCASIGRSVCWVAGGACVCVSLCTGTWISGGIGLFGGFGRRPAPLSMFLRWRSSDASAFGVSAWGSSAWGSSAWGGVARSAAFGGRFCAGRSSWASSRFWVLCERGLLPRCLWGFVRLPLGAWAVLTPGHDMLRYNRAEKACVASVSIVRRSLRLDAYAPPQGIVGMVRMIFAKCSVVYFTSYF